MRICAATHLLGLRVRIPPGGMDVCLMLCVVKCASEKDGSMVHGSDMECVCVCGVCVGGCVCVCGVCVCGCVRVCGVCVGGYVCVWCVCRWVCVCVSLNVSSV